MYKLGVLVLVAAVAANDLSVGPKTGGKKIFDGKVEASPAIWRQDKNFTYHAPNDVIRRIVITDLRPEKDGEAKIVEGGEGHPNVTIEMKSPAVFRGFEFNVEVYVEDDNQQSVGQETAQVPSQTPEVPISVSGDASDDTKQSVNQQTPQLPVPTQEPQLPVSVGNDDNLRKIRKTEEQDQQDKVTSKVFVSGSTTTTAPTSEPTSVPTTEGQKENNGQKFHIPADLGKEVTTSTPKQEPIDKDQSDVVDPVAVNNQPTHLNNTDNVAQQGVPKEEPKQQQFSDSDAQSTTEADVTSTTPDYVEKSTIENGVLHHIRIPNYAPSAYPPRVNAQDTYPSKTSNAQNSQVLNHQMAPLPYNH